MRALTVTYFTDPWCAWSWASEPNIRRLMEEYGSQLRFVYRMGGLLEDVTRFYGSGKIPLEGLAAHMREVSRQSGMPIDEKVLYDDPPTSTWPSNVAFKAAEMQDPPMAERYLRRLREAVMTERKNASKKEVFQEIAKEMGFKMEDFRVAIDSGKAELAFLEDLKECEDRRIKGFPTIVFRNERREEITMIGYRKYEDYENIIHRLTGGEATRRSTGGIEGFIRKYGRVTTIEVAEVFQMLPKDALASLEEFQRKGALRKTEVKGGALWEAVSHVSK